jgi:hypothetical protein
VQEDWVEFLKERLTWVQTAPHPHANSVIFETVVVVTFYYGFNVVLCPELIWSH